MLSAWSWAANHVLTARLLARRVFGCQERVQVRCAACAAEMPGQVPQRVTAVDARGARVCREHGQPGIQAAEAGQVGIADAVVGTGRRLPQFVGQREQLIRY